MYSDPAIIYKYCVNYFDGTHSKRQWFNDADTAIKFSEAMKAMEFTNIEVSKVIPLSEKDRIEKVFELYAQSQDMELEEVEGSILNIF